MDALNFRYEEPGRAIDGAVRVVALARCMRR